MPSAPPNTTQPLVGAIPGELEETFEGSGMMQYPLGRVVADELPDEKDEGGDNVDCEPQLGQRGSEGCICRRPLGHRLLGDQAHQKWARGAVKLFLCGLLADEPGARGRGKACDCPRGAPTVR